MIKINAIINSYLYQVIGKKTKKSKQFNKVLFQSSDIKEVVSYVKRNKLTAKLHGYNIKLSNNTHIRLIHNGVLVFPKELLKKLIK